MDPVAGRQTLALSMGNCKAHACDKVLILLFQTTRNDNIGNPLSCALWGNTACLGKILGFNLTEIIFTSNFLIKKLGRA